MWRYLLSTLAVVSVSSGSIYGAPPADSLLKIFSIGSDATNGRSLDALKRWVPQMSKIGITSMRTPDCGWGAVEKGEGQWQWDALDRRMQYLDDQHFTYGGLLLGNPRWNTLDEPRNLPVNNLTGWSSYVSQLVHHVNGRIKYWEIWNEPPNGTGTTNQPADYAKLVIASYDAAKSVDPTCLIGLSAKSVHVNYLDRVIQSGGKDHFDYIVLHPYETLGTVMNHPDCEAVFMNIVPTVRKMLAAQDPSRVNVPIWFTELGFNARRGQEVQAAALVKAYTMGIAQGVNCISWFEGMDGDSGPMGLLEGNGTPRPAYTALAQLIQYLGETPSYLGWLLFKDRDDAFVFQGAHGTVLITWAPLGQSDTIPFDQQVSIVQPNTGASAKETTLLLTDAPVIIDGVPPALVTEAKANSKKPFPWGGDYTHAHSISVTMGATNTEHGLHTQAAESIAADAVLYGGSARSGDLPGGNVFMVDPNFLTYTSTPIEIAATVRRGVANDPATLVLTYESTTGEKKAAPYEIPEGTAWNKATWQIDDSQFVSMYGFNFRLNKGPYAIQSVTVTKREP